MGCINVFRFMETKRQVKTMIFKNNKKAEFSFTNWLLALGFMSLIAIIIGNTIGDLNSKYNQDNFDDTELDNYNTQLTSLTESTQAVNSSVDTFLSEGTDKNIFDVIGGIFLTALAPLRTLFSTLGLGVAVANSFVDDLGLSVAFKEYILFVLFTTIIIGFFTFKVMMKMRDQN